MKKQGRAISQFSQRKFKEEKGHKCFMPHDSLLHHEPALQGHQVTWLYMEHSNLHPETWLKAKILNNPNSFYALEYMVFCTKSHFSPAWINFW